MDDWAHRTAATIEGAVGKIHNLTVRPITLLARGIVFGTIIITLLAILVTTLSIGIIRLLDVYLFAHREWISDLAVGGVFLLGGLALWSKRRPPVRSAQR